MSATVRRALRRVRTLAARALAEGADVSTEPDGLENRGRRHLVAVLCTLQLAARADALTGDCVDRSRLRRFADDPSAGADALYDIARSIGDALEMPPLTTLGDRDGPRLPEPILVDVVSELAGAVEDTPALDHLGQLHSHYQNWERTDHRGVTRLEKTGSLRATGLFYTPPSIAKHIVGAALDSLAIEGRDPDSFRILDPAAGTGVFLCAALRELAPRLRRAGGFDAERDLLRHLLGETLCGVDLDPQATQLARWNLRMAALDAAEEPLPLTALEVDDRLVCGNSLIFASQAEVADSGGAPTDRSAHDDALRGHYAVDPDEHGAVHWYAAFSDVLGDADSHEQGFDAVVGNPPWISFGLRDAGRVPDDLESYLRDRFAETAQYKLPLYPLFVELAARLAHEDAAIGLLLPDSFLAGSQFSNLRETLLERTNLERLTLLTDEIWSHGTAGRCVILRTRAGGPTRGSIEVQRADSGETLDRGRSTESRSVGALTAGPKARFELLFSSETREFVETMRDASVPLGEFVDFYSGCISRYGQEAVCAPAPRGRWTIRDDDGALVVEDDDAELHWRPLVASGRHVGPHEVFRNGEALYFHPDTEIRRRYAKSGFDAERYERPKLFLRQTGDELVAARDDRGGFCLNNLHVANARSPGVDLHVLAALLNSEPLGAFYHAVSMEGGRSLAQTDIELLRRLPVPAELPGDVELGRLARERCSLGTLLADFDGWFARRFDDPGAGREDVVLGELVDRESNLHLRRAAADLPSGRVTDLRVEPSESALVLRAAIDETECEVAILEHDDPRGGSFLFLALRDSLRRQWRRRVWGRGDPVDALRAELELHWHDNPADLPEANLLAAANRARELDAELHVRISELYGL